jgi:hypothetical protein
MRKGVVYCLRYQHMFSGCPEYANNPFDKKGGATNNSLHKMEVGIMTKKGSYIVGTTIALMLIGLIAFPAQGLAAEDQACSYIGSWYGFNTVETEEGEIVEGDTLEWMINVQGPSQTSGTNNLEDILFDLTLGGAFSNAVRSTTLRGVWEKTGNRTFAFTMITYAVNATGSTEWIGKMSGTATLIDDCNKEYLDLTMEIFLPGQDPFVDEPYTGFSLPNHYGYRMRVDPPFEG